MFGTADPGEEPRRIVEHWSYRPWADDVGGDRCRGIEGPGISALEGSDHFDPSRVFTQSASSATAGGVRMDLGCRPSSDERVTAADHLFGCVMPSLHSVLLFHSGTSGLAFGNKVNRMC